MVYSKLEDKQLISAYIDGQEEALSVLGTTPFFPHWCVILANFPFAALACYVLAQEWLLRKNNKSHDAEINTEVVASAL